MPRRTAAPLRALTVALALPLLLSCDLGHAVDPGPGIGIELARARAATLSDLAYRFALEIPSDPEEAILGRATIDLVWSGPGDEALVLDFAEPDARLRALRVNGREVRWRAVHDHVVIPAAALDSEARNRLELEFVAGEAGFTRTDDLVYSLFVPDRAHLSLPLFDQPDLKGSVAWEIRAPAGWTVVANGPVASSPDADAVAIEAGEPELRTWRFDGSPPISTYLMAFAAGRFEVEEGMRGGRTLRLLHREPDPVRLAQSREAIFDLHASSLAALEDYTGIAYPFEKFDIVAIPGLEYAGMEHPGAVLYRHSELFLDAGAGQGRQLGRANLVAHETAHIWMGDLVTIRWFDDLWMKEALANYMAERIVRPLFPDLDHGLRFLLSHHLPVSEAERRGDTRPIRAQLARLDEANSLYGPILYRKGPIALAQLERTVGPELFREGLRSFLARHAWGNAGWSELVEILDTLHPEDLGRWSRAWVETSGRPSIQVVWEPTEDGRGDLVLHQFDPLDRGLLWPQLLTLHAEWEGRAEQREVAFGPGSTRVVAWSGVRRPDLVIPNASGMEYARFELGPLWTEALVERLPSLESELLRGAALLLLADALAEAAVEPEQVLRQTLLTLDAHPDEFVASELVDLAGRVYWHSLSEERRAALSGELEGRLQARAAALRARLERARRFEAWRREVVAAAGEEIRRKLPGPETIPTPATVLFNAARRESGQVRLELPVLVDTGAFAPPRWLAAQGGARIVWSPGAPPAWRGR